MGDIVVLALILLLATSGYAAGRMHGQFSYRWGYRYGYRQGYFDGDRASWNRRRRDLQAAVASVLTAVTDPDERQLDLGSIYTSASRGDDEPDEPEPAVVPVPSARGAVARGRHHRTDREGAQLTEAGAAPTQRTAAASGEP